MHLVVTIYKEGTDVEVLQPEKKSTKHSVSFNRKGWNERVYYIFRTEFLFYVFSEKEKASKGNVVNATGYIRSVEET